MNGFLMVLRTHLYLCILLLIFSNFNLASAQEHIVVDSLKSELAKAKKDTLVLDLYYNIGKSYLNINTDSSKAYILNGIDKAKKGGYTEKEYFLKILLTELWILQEKYDQATNLLKKIEQYFSQTDSVSLNMVYSIYAKIYKSKELFDLAIEYHHKAINLIINSKKWQENLGVQYNNLATLYLQTKQNNKALKYLKKSLEIKKGLNLNPYKLIPTYINIGNVYNGLHLYDSAMFYLEEGLNNLNDSDERLLLAQLQSNMINTYMKIDEKTNLIPNLIKKNIGIYRKFGDSLNTSISYLQFGSYYANLEEYQAGIQYIDTAVAAIGGFGNNSFMDRYSRQLYHDIYLDMKNYEKAHLHLKALNKIDSITHEQEMKRKLDELEVKFESEKKEKEITLLKEKDKVSQLEIKRSEDKLKIRTYLISILSLMILLLLIISFFIYRQIKLKQQKKSAELEHKALRAQMNPHFVFNALNSIQRMYLEGNIDKASSFMSDFGELMRKILENSNHFTISLKEEIETLEYYLNLEKLRCHDKFTYNIDIDPSIDITTTKVPPLIVQPFVENAIWHGILPKDGSGHISISISKEKNKLKFQIQDDGVGIQEKSTTGHQSKGIEITEQRIGSKVHIENKENEYTTITFYLKVD